MHDIDIQIKPSIVADDKIIIELVIAVIETIIKTEAHAHTHTHTRTCVPLLFNSNPFNSAIDPSKLNTAYFFFNNFPSSGEAGNTIALL